MEEMYLFYLVAIIFIIILIIMISNTWWKIINFIVFFSYFSKALFEIYTDKIYDGFVPRLTTIIFILIHIVVLVIVYFLAKIVNRK